MATEPYIIDAYDAAVKAVAPNCTGVCMSELGDRSTWRICFDGVKPGDAEIAAADQVRRTFDPAAVAAPIAPITKRQMLNWLLANKGKTEADVLAAIATIPDDAARAEAEIDWKYPDGDFRRSNPFMDQLGPLFNMTSGDIDQAFVEAADPKAKWNK